MVSVVPFSSLNSLPQTEQVQYALLPPSVQVGAFASVLVRLWPAAGIFTASAVVSVVPFSSEKNLPQRSQTQYSLLPSSVQVGVLASVFVRVCDAQAARLMLYCVFDARLSVPSVYPAGRMMFAVDTALDEVL